eukprot:CAMPEP_0172441110 /NCGR_PEP_ID=MMETSP1065-20121228/1680_1 /TAXON_ID=265537 /ORGANISM="Amphiprora paludosa, Strain CCMP125" /LENGTH=456 /DNA_ID=CAMNT_0013190297 /DNA_START=124 /DNA_END=1494 /DNA_ORIENTATION=+
MTMIRPLRNNHNNLLVSAVCVWLCCLLNAVSSEFVTVPHQQRRTESCDLAGDSVLLCLHGGKCAEGHDEWAPTNSGAVCDCSTAFEVEGGEVSLFAGRTCETQILPDDYCLGKNSVSKDSFCLNGGSCREEAVDSDTQPCTCPDGFVGRHCEYQEQNLPPDCPLSCSDHGRCEFGLSPYEEEGPNDVLDLTNGGTHEFAHCICEDGYAGTNCDFEYIECVKDQSIHYCYHGSTCKETSSTDDTQVCQCLDATLKTVAGDYCEFEATDNCETPAELFVTDKPPSYAMAVKNDAFCVNDGVCLQDIDDGLYYCECGPNHDGKHCESKMVPAPAPTDTSAPTESTYIPTADSSITEFPTAPTISPTVATDTPTESGTVWSSSDSTIDPSDPDNSFLDELNDNESNNDDDDVPAGAKAVIVLAVFAFIGIWILVICYFRRRSRMVNQAVFQEGHGNNEFV